VHCRIDVAYDVIADIEIGSQCLVENELPLVSNGYRIDDVEVGIHCVHHGFERWHGYAETAGIGDRPTVRLVGRDRVLFTDQGTSAAAAFAVNGMQYAWVDSYATNLIVEYQLDIKIYVGIVLIITTYGLWRSSRAPAESPAPLQDRLVVQTGTGESIVRLEDIDYLEASRNYVVVHAGSREYLLRNTINKMEKQLAGDTFIRTHRGYRDAIRSRVAGQAIIACPITGLRLR
jgi:hypothetical protein